MNKYINKYIYVVTHWKNFQLKLESPFIFSRILLRKYLGVVLSIDIAMSSDSSSLYKPFTNVGRNTQTF